MPKRYWENFKEVREEKGLRQEEVARRLGLKRQGNLPSRENHSQSIPKEKLVRKHAEVLGCETSRLFVDVELPYDKLRGWNQEDNTVSGGNANAPRAVAETKAQLLLRRCENEQTRVAATRDELGEKIGAISKYVLAELGDLAAIVSSLPRRQAPMARGRGPGSPHHRKRRRRRNDQERHQETPPD